MYQTVESYYKRKLIFIEASEEVAPEGILLESGRSMYDGCIAAYSKVYHKGKSPYSSNWRLEDHMEEFGNDAALAEMFGQIKTQERRVCESEPRSEFTYFVADCSRRGF